MADITVTTDFSQVNNLKDALNSADSTYVKVVNTVVRENNRLKKLLKMAAKDTADTNKIKEQSDAIYAAKMQQAADRREKARAREAARAEKEAARIAAANEKAIASELKLRAAAEKKAAQDKLALATNKADTAFALGLQRVKEEEGQIAQKQAEILRLEVMYNKVAVATKVYEQAEKSLNRAVLLGVLTADQKEAKLAELSIAYQKVGNDANKAQTFINRFGENAQISGRGLNQFGVYAQQVGYQVGDFLVQIQSGTNFLVAFGQQATQLAGLVPGVLGAALGIGISLATAIGAAFMRTSEQAKESKKGVDTYKDALENLNQVITETSQNLVKLQFGGSDTAFAENEVKNLKSRVQGLRELLAELRSTETSGSSTGLQQISAMFSRDAAVEEFKTRKEELRILEDRLQVFEALNEAQRMLNGGLSTAAGIQKGIVYDTEVQLRLNRELRDLQEAVAEGTAEPQKNLDIQKEYQKLLQAGIKPIEAQAEAQYKVERALIQAKIASGQLTSEQKNAEKAALVILDTTYALEKNQRKIALETALLEKGLSQSAIDGAKLAGLDLSNLSDAAMDVLQLATNMGIAVQAAANLSMEYDRLDKLNQNAGRSTQSNKTPEFGTGPNAGKNIEETTKRLAEIEKTRADHADRYYKNLQDQEALIKQRDEDVAQLKQAYADELTQLKQQKDLLQTIKDFGEGSVEAKAKEAQFARETYQAELQREGLVGNFLTILMQQYDEVVALKGEMDGMSDLQREINQYAVEFAQTDLASGVDAAAAAALALADRLGISVDRAKEMMALGYGAPVVFDPRDPDFDPAKASAARAAQLQKDRFGFSYGTMVTGTKFADDKKGGAGGGGSEKDVLADFQKQLELERELVGTSEAYQKVRQALGDDFRKTSPEVIAGLVQQATEIERLIELEEQRKSIMDTVKSSLEDGFMSMVDGTKSVKDAFKSMAAEIIKELYRVFVVQQIVGGISGGVGSLFGGGNFLTGPSTGSFGLPFGRAAGGPVIANQPYIVGERGPELVIPRSSGMVLNHDKTKAAIGGSNDVTVNNNISVTGSDAAMVRAEVAKMIPQITNATKAAVIDARLRGGQMKQAFR